VLDDEDGVAGLDEPLQHVAFRLVFERALGRRQAGDEAQCAGRVIDHRARAVGQVDDRVVVAPLPRAAVVVRAVAVFGQLRDEAPGACL